MRTVREEDMRTVREEDMRTGGEWDKRKEENSLEKRTNLKRAASRLPW